MSFNLKVKSIMWSRFFKSATSLETSTSSKPVDKKSKNKKKDNHNNNHNHQHNDFKTISNQSSVSTSYPSLPRISSSKNEPSSLGKGIHSTGSLMDDILGSFDTLLNETPSSPISTTMSTFSDGSKSGKECLLSCFLVLPYHMISFNHDPSCFIFFIICIRKILRFLELLQGWFYY